MATTETTGTAASAAGKHLTFSLNGESYGVPVLQVREITRPTSITPMPQVPAYVRGVINLRGRIIPVIDLAAKLELPRSMDASEGCIIVVQLDAGASRSVLVGLLVDAVEEVANIPASAIEPPPEFGSQLATTAIIGMAKLGHSVKVLLNLEQLLSTAATLALRAQA